MHTDVGSTPLICHCAPRRFARALAPDGSCKRRERIRLGIAFSGGASPGATKITGLPLKLARRRTIGPITRHLSARRCCHRSRRCALLRLLQQQPVTMGPSRVTVLLSRFSLAKGVGERDGGGNEEREGGGRIPRVFKQATMWRSCHGPTKNRRTIATCRDA